MSLTKKTMNYEYDDEEGTLTIFISPIWDPISTEDWKHWRGARDWHGIKNLVFLGLDGPCTLTSIFPIWHRISFPYLPTVTVKGTVTEIGKNAFSGCSTCSVILGNEIVKIADNAFEGCTNLTSITLSDSLRHIGNGAFKNSGLESIFIPDSVQSIGSEVFSGCIKLSSITVGKNNAMFYAETEALYDKNKTKLIRYVMDKYNLRETFRIPDTVKTVDPDAFDSLYLPSEILVPKSLSIEIPGINKVKQRVKIIDDGSSQGQTIANSNTASSTFRKRSGTEQNSLANNPHITRESPSKKSISYPAISHIRSDASGKIAEYDERTRTLKITGVCKKYGDILKKYPDTEHLIIESDSDIEENAFPDNYALTTVSIGKSVKNIHITAFSECYSLISISVASDNCNYTSENGVLFNKDKSVLLRYPGQKPDPSYVIPDSVKIISYRAFFECINLMSVVIPRSVEKIWTFAFYGCDSLHSITIPKSVKMIRSCAFSQCHSLLSISVEEGNSHFCSENDVLFNKTRTILLQYPIGKTASRYEIPDTVISIDNTAFEGCHHLKSVTIPDSVTSIGFGVFYACDSITSLTIPDSVKSIGFDAFANCRSLTSIIVPKTIVLEENNHIRGCTSLKSVVYRDKEPSSSQDGVKNNVQESGSTADHLSKQKLNSDKYTNKSKYQPVESPGVRFEDIVGLDDAKQRIFDSVILPIRRPDLFESMKIEKGDGILLYGPPGTGKTMFARAVATEINAAFFTVKGADIESSRSGETESNIHELFNEARKYETAVIFFDEFETLGMSRNIGFNQDIFGRGVTALLTEIQGFEKNTTTLIVMAATNRPWDIDAALLRPGRFGCHIYVGLPDSDARKELINKQFEGVAVRDSVDFDRLAELTDGCNGADITELCKRIKLNSIRRNIDNKTAEVTEDDVDKSINGFKPSVKTNELERYKTFQSQD